VSVAMVTLVASSCLAAAKYKAADFIIRNQSTYLQASFTGFSTQNFVGKNIW